MRVVHNAGSRRTLSAVGLLTVLALTAACGSTPKESPGVTITTTTTTRTTASPTIKVVTGHHVLRIGQVAQIGTAGGSAAALIKIGKPKVSRTRLSSSYGYAPAHGYYVNFPIKVYNDGKKPLVVDRLDFWVVVPGQGKVNTNQGNSPFSGASQQLDTTELESGQGVSNYLAFDVSSTHGTFVYGPGGKKVSVSWRY
ncbi:MAG: hypothetical protein ACTHK4_07215 [Mycobacteriales bacterium]